MKYVMTLFAVVAVHIAAIQTAFADDAADLKRPASWNYPTAAEIKAELDVWIAEQRLDDVTAEQVEELWRDVDTGVDAGDADADGEVASQDDGENAATTEVSPTVSPSMSPSGNIDEDLAARVIETIRLVAPESRPFIDACRSMQADAGRFSIPPTMLLDDGATPPVVRDHLRLLVAGWLADHRLYDEAMSQLERIEIGNVADPAKLLFYKAASHFRLRQQDEGLAAVDKLLERADDIPQRYKTVGQLMQADLKSLKADSLDEVARIMDSITVRLGHGRAGQRVRKEEDDVIEKLDKMIEDLEKQRQQQQQQSGNGSGGGKRPSNPMQDSMPGGGSGPGNVDPKRLAEEIDWGNLPPKEREEALQRLGNEFPSHYREVIEEYFRTLARKEAETP